jgi:predicted secreted Zn-dependent protease
MSPKERTSLALIVSVEKFMMTVNQLIKKIFSRKLSFISINGCVFAEIEHPLSRWPPHWEGAGLRARCPQRQGGVATIRWNWMPSGLTDTRRK